MDSVQEILTDVWRKGRQSCVAPDLESLVDQIRRAALVEAIRGCRLDWEEDERSYFVRQFGNDAKNAALRNDEHCASLVTNFVDLVTKSTALLNRQLTKP